MAVGELVAGCEFVPKCFEFDRSADVALLPEERDHFTEHLNRAAELLNGFTYAERLESFLTTRAYAELD